jgi:hypothetical protein
MASPENSFEIQFGQIYIRKSDEFHLVPESAEKRLWIITDVMENDYFMGAKIIDNTVGAEKLSIESTEDVEYIESLLSERWSAKQVFFGLCNAYGSPTREKLLENPELIEHIQRVANKSRIVTSDKDKK